MMRTSGIIEALFIHKHLNNLWLNNSLALLLVAETGYAVLWQPLEAVRQGFVWLAQFDVT